MEIQATYRYRQGFGVGFALKKHLGSYHLGNVLATVLDRKTGASSTGAAPTVGSLYDHWNADLAQVSDYYPGGMMMPGRNIEYSWSRMGFNGQAKDDEVYGKGNLNTATFWEMDTRILKRWDVDPVTNPSVSSYAVFDGNPIWKSDVLGNDPNTYEVDHKAGTVNKIDNVGGNKTDVIIDKNMPVDATDPGKHVLPTTVRTVPVQTIAGKGPTEQRGPGYRVTAGVNDGPIQMADPTAEVIFTAMTLGTSLPIKIASAENISAEGAVWAQKTYGKTFSTTGQFAGQTIDNVASALKSGTMSTSDIPIDLITRNGQTFILNTRSSVALTEAGVPRSAWNVVNRTGQSAFEKRLTNQLIKNNIPNGTNTIRSGSKVLTH